jgi:hypothetical protein
MIALGCNKFGPNTTSTSNTNSASNTNAAPAKIAKVVDLPATIGKSKDDIKKMVNGTPTHEDPWLEYTLDLAQLTFMFGKTTKATNATLKFKSISFGDASISGTQTAEQLATMAGIDLKGKAPKSTSSLADTYEIEIGGKKAEAVIYHSNGKFDSVMIHADSIQK